MPTDPPPDQTAQPPTSPAPGTSPASADQAPADRQRALDQARTSGDRNAVLNYQRFKRISQL